jgi:hypothetical protein
VDIDEAPIYSHEWLLQYKGELDPGGSQVRGRATGARGLAPSHLAQRARLGWPLVRARTQLGWAGLGWAGLSRARTQLSWAQLGSASWDRA